MQVIRAEDRPRIRLWFNGRDVSDESFSCWVSDEPGRLALGWVRMYKVLTDDHGTRLIKTRPTRTGDRFPVTYLRIGLVRWEPLGE